MSREGEEKTNRKAKMRNFDRERQKRACLLKIAYLVRSFLVCLLFRLPWGSENQPLDRELDRYKKLAFMRDREREKTNII